MFFNQADFDPGEIDPGKLKNDLDSVKLDLRQKEKEKDELRKECRSKEVGNKHLYFSCAIMHCLVFVLGKKLGIMHDLFTRENVTFE